MLANAGLPMIVAELPGMVVAFCPVVAVEAYLAHRMLAVPDRRAFHATFAANVWTTVIGVPPAWLVLLACNHAITSTSAFGESLARNPSAVSSATLVLSNIAQSAVIGPWGPELGPAMAPLAAACLLIPALPISVWLEARVYRALWPELPRDAISRFAWRANTITYAGLLLAFVAWVLLA